MPGISTAGPRARQVETARGVLDLGERTWVMGILNVTPDSFYDGGRHVALEAAVARGRQLVAEGADILDVGGESTRPGSAPVDAPEETRRVAPVIERLRAELDVPIAVDTSKATVAEAALAAGADIVNDVSALGDPAMAGVVARSGAALVLMHMRGTPATMQRATSYGDLVEEVCAELDARVVAAREAGIPDARLVVDPGIGFAKRAKHNWELIRQLGAFRRWGRPLLVGPSRKSFLGEALGGVGPEERLEATQACVVACIVAGADIVRVHDPGALGVHVRIADRVRHAPEAA